MDTYYHIVPIAGKGLGCVALKDIQKGTIILQEKPQCAPEDCANLPEDARSIPNVLKAFHRVGERSFNRSWRISTTPNTTKYFLIHFKLIQQSNMVILSCLTKKNQNLNLRKKSSV